jgi:phosphoglucomutase
MSIASTPPQSVAFGTSGHRGSSLDHAFKRGTYPGNHPGYLFLRKQQRIDGPQCMGIDNHALSEPAFASVLEVITADGVEVMVDATESAQSSNLSISLVD